MLWLSGCFLIRFFRFVSSEFNYTENGDTVEYSHYMNNMSNVVKELFKERNYDKYVTPIFEPMPENYSTSETRRLRINFLLFYVKLFDLDAEKQIFAATIEFRMNWRDARLSWNETKFGGVKSIYVTSDLLWIPDSRLSNAKSLDPVMGGSMQIAHIFSNGTVHITTAYYAETACTINANVFPFDSQKCKLAILSLSLGTYISYGLQIQEGPNVLGGNGEWVITKAVTTNFTPAADLEIVGFVIMIKRVPNFYVYVIALPCFVLTILSVVGMFWSPNVKKEQLTKLSIGLTSLVSMTVLLDMLAYAIPKTQVFPLLGIYVVSCVGITSVACVVVVMHSLPNPEKQPKKELEKLKEANKSKTRSQLIFESIKARVWQRHFLFHSFFQTLNLVGFIVFLSFWRD